MPAARRLCKHIKNPSRREHSSMYNKESDTLPCTGATGEQRQRGAYPGTRNYVGSRGGRARR